MSATTMRSNNTVRASLGLALLAGTVLVLAWDYTGGLRNFFDGSSRSKVTAIFRNVATLRTGDQVRVGGVPVGEVKSIDGDVQSKTARVTMEVDQDKVKLYRDARATVSWRSVLGGAFIVVLSPGTSVAGPLGSRRISAAQTTTQTELDDITAVLQGDARRGLVTLPPELSRALRAPEVPAKLAGALQAVSPDIAAATEALRGTQKDKDLTDLVRNAAATVKALDDPGSLRGVVSGAAAIMETTAARSSEINTTLVRAAPIFAETDRTLDGLDRTLRLTDPLVQKLEAPASDVAPTVRGLRPVLDRGNALIDDARPLLRNLKPAVRSLASASRIGTPLLNAIEPSLTRLDKTILPYLNETDPETQHSAAEMIGSGVGGLAMVASPIDNNGHFLRFPASAGNASVYLPCQTYFGNPDKPKAIACKTFEQALETFLNANPLAPAPGTAPPPPGKRAKQETGR